MKKNIAQQEIGKDDNYSNFEILEKNKKELILETKCQSESIGFSFKEETPSHILEIAEKDPTLKNLIEKNLYLLMKFGWMYEHAPSFIFFNKNIEPSKIDEFIRKFALEYKEAMAKEIEINEPEEKIEAVETTFWKKDINPIENIKQAIEKGVTGIELAIDFHPFNGAKLMPQEYISETRKKIKEIVKKHNFNILLHSSVIGPYGKNGQVFFDMTEHKKICEETIELAKDIGAKSIVFHITDLNKSEQLAEIVKFAKGSEVKIAFENTWTKEGKMHSSDDFLKTMDRIYQKLDEEERKNLAVAFDAAHYNLANEDPIVSLLKVINWCCKNKVDLNELHLNMNYGPLPFYRSFSADVHNSISSCGPINNEMIIKIAKSISNQNKNFKMPHIVAEQIPLLSKSDIKLINNAETILCKFNIVTNQGKENLKKIFENELITKEIKDEEAYQFIAGLDMEELKKHLINRELQKLLQEKKVSTESAQTIADTINGFAIKYKLKVFKTIDKIIEFLIKEKGPLSKENYELFSESIKGSLKEIFTKEIIEDIFKRSKIYNKDEIICKQGDSGNVMWVIKKGFVSVKISEKEIRVLGPGDIVGEMSPFLSEKRTATLIAKEPGTELGELSQEDLFEILLEINDQSRILLEQLNKTMSQKIRNMNGLFSKSVLIALKANYINNETLDLANKIADKKLTKIDLFKHPIFEKISIEEIENEFKVEEIKYKEGEIIFEQGKLSDKLGIIINGEIEVVDSNGNILKTLKEGEVVGEMGIIENMPRSANVRSKTDAEIIFISLDEIKNSFKKKSVISYKLMANIFQNMIFKLRHIDEEYKIITDIISKTSEYKTTLEKANQTLKKQV